MFRVDLDKIIEAVFERLEDDELEDFREVLAFWVEEVESELDSLED